MSSLEKAELVVNDKRHTALESSAVLTPMQELQMQIVRTGDIEKLKELRAIEKEWRADQAKQAFVEAVAAFKAESISIIKDKENKQYSTNGHKAMYVSLGNLVTTVTPFLSKHGLSVRWDIDQSSSVKVSCILTHSLGHSESVSMVCPPDKSGAKNPIQEIKSAITYAKACTFESICGLASTDANVDDDGNGAGMPDKTFVEHAEKIENAPNDTALQQAFAAAYKAAKAAQDNPAMSQFIAKKDARKKELREGR